MVHIKSASFASVVIGAALTTGALALPAGQALSTPAILEVDAQVLRLPDSLPSAQRAFSAGQSAGKRMWKGRLGRRGPWRQSTPEHPVENDLINIDLSGSHDRHGNLLNIETIESIEPRRHNEHDKVVIIEDERHRHRHDDVVVHDRTHAHVHSRRSHDHAHDHVDVIDVNGYRHGDVYIDGSRHHHHDDVTYIEGDRHHHGHNHGHVHEHIHEHIHEHDHEHDLDHGDDVQIIGKRRHNDNDDVVVINDGYHHGDIYDGHHRHGDVVHVIDSDRHHHHDDDGDFHQHVHEHTHEHIHDKRRHDGETTTIIKNGRHKHHGTTIVEGSRHRGDVTIVDKRDIIDLNIGRHRHHDDVVVVDQGRHRHNRVRPVTVIQGRSHGSTTSLSDDGEGTQLSVDDLDTEKDPEVTLGKRRSSRVTVIDDRRPWRETDEYYGSDSRYAYGQPIYFGHRHRGDVTVVNRRDHSDRHDGWNRHGRHGHHGGHTGHGHGKDEVTIINTKRDGGVDMGGAPGYIDVTSPVFNSTTAQRIASLVLSVANGSDPNSNFILNASNNIRTQVYLVPINSTNASTPSSTPTDGSIKVNLKLPIFVAQDAKVEPYCATFDPAPTAPAPLSVTKCLLDGEGDDPHQSQQFWYDPETGVIHPDWQPSAAAQEILNSVNDNVDDDMIAADAYTTDDSTGTGAVNPSSTPVLRRATPSASSSTPPPLDTSGPKSSTDSTPINSNPSNVTLVFTPVNPSITTSNAIMPDDEAEGDYVGAMSTDENSNDDNETEPGSVVGGPDSAQMGTRDDEDLIEAQADKPSYTAPYDWRWIKSSDDHIAPSAEITLR